MKTVNVKINLLSFAELSEDAKEKAINEHRNFLLSVTSPEDFDFDGDYEATMKEYEENDKPIIENIEANKYLFFESGELACCTTYIGKHEKAGMTEFYFMGNTYQL
jgi:hypothetical protein